MNVTQNDRLMQVTSDTLIVGVDVGSQTHFCRAFDWRGFELSRRVFKFSNTGMGFLTFLRWTEELMNKTEMKKVIVGCEPTGCYWLTFQKFLQDHKVQLVTVNPFTVNRSRELDDNSPEKSDLKDPKTIALLVKDGRFSTSYLPSGVYAEIREASVCRDQIMKQHVRLSNQIQGWLQKFFPEYFECYADWDSTSGFELLKEAPLPQDILKLGAGGINQIWRNSMLIKPNEQYSRNDNDMENDLYRKFNAIFTEILHPDDSSYDLDTYCETKNLTEDKIFNILNNYSDCIVPILGYTGMGKTYLMHYCIRKKYNVQGLLKNMSFIGKDGINKSIIIYASYDANKMDKVADGRLAGKLAAASNEILKELKMDNDTREGKLSISKKVAKYIRQNKAELLEENAPSTDALDIEKAESLYNKNQLAYEQEKLKWLLTEKATDIKDVIVILDDIEGLVNVKKKNLIEYELIDTYLKMYDCLRRCENEDRKYKVKLFLCMRERTYNEVKKSAWYNTHRVNNDPFFLTSGINLGEIFLKRFSAIECRTGVLEEIKKKDTWEEAKSVLNRLSAELDRILGNSILEICNYNVCDAVQLFASILGNRQWTQKSERAQASFKIEEYQYYLSPASCYRAIAMKNAVIYTNEHHLTNIFYDNDKIGYCLPVYILMMMNEVGANRKELSLKQIQDNIIKVLKCKSDIEKEKREQIEEIVHYFTEREIFFEKIIVLSETDVDCKYYIAPKGKAILRNFFDNTIFLEIYRDDIFLDDSRHNPGCSNSLTREELFMEVIKIIDEIGNEEMEYMKTFENMGTLTTYYRLWKNERISIRLIEAQKKSLYKYYKQNVPDKLKKGLVSIETKYREVLDKITY